MKPFSKTLMFKAIIATTVVLGLFVEFKQAGPILQATFWGNDALSGEVVTTATTTYTRREFAEAIGSAVRGM